MQTCGMLLDMTHIADESFWEALDHYSGPILASHQNCRALAPGQRQFSDEQLKAVIRMKEQMTETLKYCYGNSRSSGRK